MSIIKNNKNYGTRVILLGEPPVPPTPTDDYFYVEDVSGNPNTLSITKSATSAPTVEVFYSTDQQNWTSMGSTSRTAITATVPANSKLYLKATANKWAQSSSYYTIINTTGNCNVGGNIMSLLYGDNYTGQTTFPAGSTYTFTRLFDSSSIINAKDLVLPATTLADYCYRRMFENCTALTTPPALPATTLANNCYNQMFDDCTALTTAPALPATTLAQQCYSNMFYNCTALTTAPALPATTLATQCYFYMFQNCSSLTTAPASLPATTLADNCYYGMFKGCSALTTAPALPATTLATNCYYDMFYNCSSLTTAPELPATTLAEGCYFSMFVNCSSLTATPTFVATQVDTNSYFAMFERCAALTTVAPLPNASWSGVGDSPYRYMFTTCPLINSITTYFTGDYTNQNILEGWLTDVSATGDFYNLGGATFASGASGIPSGWTEHTSL